MLWKYFVPSSRKLLVKNVHRLLPLHHSTPQLPLVFFFLPSLPCYFKLFSQSFKTLPCLIKFFVVDNAHEIQFAFFQKPVNTWRKSLKVWWFWVILAICWSIKFTHMWFAFFNFSCVFLLFEEFATKITTCRLFAIDSIRKKVRNKCTL